MPASTKWPKVVPELSREQARISDDFMKHWHEVLPERYSMADDFNHRYPVRHGPTRFRKTLEIGAGIGEHLKYELLEPDQFANYYALELRENMAAKIRERFPQIEVVVGDCQSRLTFDDNFFDRILAVHVLEHLPNLPAAISEMYRLCHKENGIFSVVLPCEGGLAYSLARRISAQRIFEKRYKQSYRWFIEREHLNRPAEVFSELEKYFRIIHRQFFPLHLPSVALNLCIGLTLKPRKAVH
jgi:SAM-dependent methyltransferase